MASLEVSAGDAGRAIEATSSALRSGPGAEMRSTGRLSVAVLLTGAMVVSALMQFAIGALGPALIDDLGLSRPQLGALAAVYYLAAAALSPVLGRRIDRVDSSLALAAVFVGAGVTLVLAGLAPSYELLLLALVPAGAVAATGNPVTNKVIAGLSGARGALTGLKQSGVQIGALAAGGLLPPLSAAIGWRGALTCFGVACFAGLAMLRWLPPASASHSHSRPAPVDLAKAIRRLCIYAFSMGVGMASITAFLPLYGVQRLGLGDVTAGALIAVVAVGGVFSRIAWSAVSERHPGGPAAPLWILAAVAVGGTGLVAAGQAVGAWSLWAGAVVFGTSAAAWNGVAMLTVLSGAPAGTAGHASGRLLMAFFLGLCVSAPVFGSIVDATSSYVAGWALTAAAFVVATVVARPLAGSGGGEPVARNRRLRS